MFRGTHNPASPQKKKALIKLISFLCPPLASFLLEPNPVKTQNVYVLLLGSKTKFYTLQTEDNTSCLWMANRIVLY
jgi:hypothetical protein